MAPHGNRGAPLVATVRFGTAELRRGPGRPRAWTLRDVLHGAELDAFAGGARARLDAPR